MAQNNKLKGKKHQPHVFVPWKFGKSLCKLCGFVYLNNAASHKHAKKECK